MRSILLMLFFTCCYLLLHWLGGVEPVRGPDLALAIVISVFSGSVTSAVVMALNLKGK